MRVERERLATGTAVQQTSGAERRGGDRLSSFPMFFKSVTINTFLADPFKRDRGQEVFLLFLIALVLFPFSSYSCVHSGRQIPVPPMAPGGWRFFSLMYFQRSDTQICDFFFFSFFFLFY
jgi:hypothetical protein